MREETGWKQLLAPRFYRAAIKSGAVADCRELRFVCEGAGTALLPKGLFYFSQDGLTEQPTKAMTVNTAELEEMLSCACSYAVYAAQEQLVRGYVTVRGGHRIGVAGKAVTKNGSLTAITDISALCIRIARDLPLAAERILPSILSEGIPKNTLIVGRPGTGKTTCLRSLSYLLAQRYRQKVVVADERGELASVYEKVPQLSVGCTTCVLDRFDKTQAAEHAVRALAPDVFVTDELGNKHEEIQACLRVMASGVCLIASLHGDRVSFEKNETAKALLSTGQIEKVIFLSDKKGVGEAEKTVTVK